MQTSSHARDRLAAFVEAERDRLNNRTGNILGAYANQLIELLAFLEVTADECWAANLAWYDSFHEYRAEVDATFEAQCTRDVEETSDMRTLREETQQAGLVLFLRIETFYLFAKILLDKLARLPHYFGATRKVRVRAHSSLADHQALPKFAQGLGLTPPPPSLTTLIDGLGTRVSDYRDSFITHAYSPRTFRGITFSLDRNEAAIMTGKLYPHSDAESENPTSSETPLTLLPLIENYITELLDYLEANHEKAFGRLDGAV